MVAIAGAQLAATIQAGEPPPPPLSGNVIAGGSNVGVEISGTGTGGNVLIGNFIGIGRDGTTPTPNAVGVRIFFDDSVNTIGGIAAAGAGNVISGNTGSGVWLDNAAGPGHAGRRQQDRHR